MFDYLSNPDEIYRRSFAEIRCKSEFGKMSNLEVNLSVRLIHACGIPGISKDLRFSPSAIPKGIAALERGQKIFVDSSMVASGIIKENLIYGNKVICTLNQVRRSVNKNEKKITRSAAAVELWRDQLDGAICVFGNAPTALFRLLELINSGSPRPAMILAFPVGFIGASESKQAVTEHSCGIPYITLLG